MATNPVVTSGEYKISLKELIVGTKYYLRAYAINSIGTTYGAEVTFTTLTKAPTLTTTSASNVTISSATVGGNISSNGGAAVTESGVCYGTTTLPAASNSKVATNPLVSTGAFTASLSGLTNATTYYVRAYAINSSGTSYGNEVSFTTTASAVIVTSSAQHLFPQRANLYGEITSNGGSAITESGFCYGTSASPTTAGTKIITTPLVTSGAYNILVNSLTENTTYYVRAYAINANGTFYGQEVTVVTPAAPVNLAIDATTGFESDGNTGIFTAWSPNSGYQFNYVTAGPGGANGSTGFGKLTCAAGENQLNSWTLKWNQGTNSKFRLNFYIKSPTISTMQAWIGVSNPWTEFKWFDTIPVTTAWAKISLEYWTSGTADVDDPELRLKILNATAGDLLYIDGISIEGPLQ